MATLIEMHCKECNNTFTVKKGREKLFCSVECKKKHRHDIDRIYYIEKHCEHCDKIFTSKIKENKKFCSYKCSGLNKKTVSREVRKCQLCGNEFTERIKRDRKFCSESCRKEWQLKPENIINRIERCKITLLNKYGVDSTFKVPSIQNKALIKLRKTYAERGGDIIKNMLMKLELNRQEVLNNRFNTIGYKILCFNNESKTLQVQHPDGHIFEEDRKLLVNRLNHNVELSTTLQPISSPRTTFEVRICEFLKNNNIEYKPNDRRTIKGELDIYIPTHNLAIEIDGLHWHSERYINDNYHLNKTNKCNEKGIQLLHFFEDELHEKYDIIESMISCKLGIINNKIYARKCKILEIDAKTSSEFLTKNHIQGNVNSSIKIGLFYDNELVSLMTFGSLRSVLGNTEKKEGEYEMLRFCNKLNFVVVGGASKLYTYFKSKYQPIKVTSFSNRRYSNGNLYKQLNFKFDNITKPNYWYVIGKKRKHRFLFRKDVLIKNGFDKNKTEHQIMIDRDIPRIYDCGNIKYVD